MTLDFAIGDLSAAPPATARHAPWSWPLSAAAHALLLALLLALWTAQPTVVPPTKTINVQVLTPAEYDAATAAPKPAAPEVPKQQQAPAPLAPLTVPPIAPSAPAVQSTPAPAAPATAPDTGMVHASRLFSTSLLRERASLEVKNTLPTLAPYERITQLCNIEATEQIRRAIKGSNPETVSASAFAETNLIKGVLVAPGAAYRSHAKWFAMAFNCTVRSDLTGVADFSFKLGPAIPRDQWDAHDLIGIDEDDEELGSTPP